MPTFEEVCSHPEVDYVDVCTFPNFRLEPLEACARAGKAIQVQKPMATNLATARQMIDIARQAGIVLGCRQPAPLRRTPPSSSARPSPRAASASSCRPTPTSSGWRDESLLLPPHQGELGGRRRRRALINQAVHQVDVLNYLTGGVAEVFGYWQLARAPQDRERRRHHGPCSNTAAAATGVIQGIHRHLARLQRTHRDPRHPRHPACSPATS